MDNHQAPLPFVEEENAICLRNPEGVLLAQVVVEPGEDGHLELTHTWVDSSLAGQGIAGRLVEAAVFRLRREGKQATARCSYAAHWLEKNPQWQQVLLPPGKR